MPIVTMIAGPNGSGKTTLTREMMRNGINFGVYINPDDIAAGLTGDYDSRVRKAQLEADRVRNSCLTSGTSFSFETVMSHQSKIDILVQAKAQGFSVVLYFVSTTAWVINVDRVANRVVLGGHDVPVDKIVTRYDRTMRLVPQAIKIVDRAFLFDNSTLQTHARAGFRLVAAIERTDGEQVATSFPPVPEWTESVLRQVALKTAAR